MSKLLAALFLVGSSFASPAYARAVSSQPVASAEPTTFTMPPVWSRSAPQAGLTVVSAPEGDLHVAIVEVAEARDPKSAAEAAWRTYRPAGIRKIKLLADRPGRNGWDQGAVINYETSPNEHVNVSSYPRRYGKHWTVAIVEGNEATSEKRRAAINLIIQSMRPVGYQRESFAGRTAHELDAGRVAQLLDFVRHASAELKVPGVGLALIDHGRVVYEGGVGVREVGKPERVDAHTRFMIASNTKSMSTLLLAKLVDEGKIGWNEPVTQAYPGFRLGSDSTTKSVLVRHLVCACTGLPRKDYELLFTTTPKTPASDTFKLLARTEPTSGFGEVFQYNNLMASAAGYLAGHIFHPELELGQAFDRAMKENIFDPLGMHDTTLSMAEALKRNHASPHDVDLNDALAVTRQDINYAIAPFRPAGGAWSSPHDMILYVQNELAEGRLPNGKQLMAPANLLARRQRGVPIGEDQWYGMGLREDATWGVSVIHHGGDLEGYHSDMYAIPAAQVGAVLLTNSDRGPLMRRAFMRRLLEVLYDGKPEAVADVDAQAKSAEADFAQWRSKLIVPVPNDVGSGLAATYVSPDLGTLLVVRHGSTLAIAAQAWQADVALRKNEDRTLSLVTISPGLKDFDFVIGKNAAGKRILTTRDGQHTYVFTEASAQ